jgi:peptidoglycan/xylan/chitin deacetylase (PgdA/CDA1 family)
VSAPDRSAVLRKAEKAANLCLRRKALRIRRKKGLISFTFDDFPESAYSIGGAILQKFDLLGTYYASAGLMGAENHLGRQFSKEQLKALIADGHELGCHTYHHLRSWSSDSITILDSVRKNASEIERALGTYQLGSFAYPFGETRFSDKKALGNLFCCCRGIAPGINVGQADLNLLRANCLYSGRTDIDAIAELIRENDQVGGWLIFYTHDVRASPSDYGCTPDYFETVVACAARSSSAVLPIRNAIGALAFG